MNSPIPSLTNDIEKVITPNSKIPRTPPPQQQAFVKPNLQKPKKISKNLTQTIATVNILNTLQKF